MKARNWIAATVLAGAMTLGAAGTSVAAEATTTASTDTTECRWTAESNQTEYWCNVRSTAYPHQVGPYGFVGSRDDVCSAAPRGSSEVRPRIACFAAPTTEALKWDGSKWAEVRLGHGTRGYIWPGNSTWTYLRVDGTWHLVHPADLYIEWRAWRLWAPRARTTTT